jgi:transposase
MRSCVERSERKLATSYTAEFKASAVKLAVESGRPVAQTARELGIRKDTLYGWVRQYRGQSQPHQEMMPSEPLDQELKRLRREGSILREERDILKKAAA